VFYHWPPILWISKTVKHPSSLFRSVENFILWTQSPHNSPWKIPGSWSSLSMMDALSVIENLLWLQNSLLSHPCTVSQHKEGGLYITIATTLHVCVVLFDSCDTVSPSDEHKWTRRYLEVWIMFIRWADRSHSPITPPPSPPRINNTVCLTPGIHT